MRSLKTAIPSPLPLFLAERSTPIGGMRIVFDAEGALRALDWEDYAARMMRLLRLHYGAEGRGFTLASAAVPAGMAEVLDAYFAGDLRALDAIAVRTGGTPFQREVWAVLRTIAPGEVVGYGALAARLGRPGASRAVGLANGANPVGVVVPCHRVVGAYSSLTGYGGGLHRKRWLLAHEGAYIHPA